MKVKDLQSESYHQAIVDTLKAIKQTGNNTGMMLSGGMDSAEIAVAIKEAEMDAAYFCSEIKDILTYDNLQDCIGAKLVAKKLDIKVDFIECLIKQFLEGWNGNFSKYAAFAYKDGKLWTSIARSVKEKGISLLINGNDADNLLNLGYTKTDVVRNISYGSQYLQDMREVTANSTLEKVFKDENLETTNVLRIWQKYHDCEFSKERFLAWCVAVGNNFPKYRGIVIDKAATNRGMQVYEEMLIDKMHELIKLYDDNDVSDARELVLEGKLIADIDAENVRVITGACCENKVDCFLLHASPLVYDAVRKMTFDERDIVVGKRESLEYLNKHIAYQDVMKEKYSIPEKGTCTSSDMWEVTYGILNDAFDFENTTNFAKEVFEKMELFDMDRLQELINTNVGVKMRVAWFGYIYMLYSKSCY